MQEGQDQLQDYSSGFRELRDNSRLQMLILGFPNDSLTEIL